MGYLGLAVTGSIPILNSPREFECDFSDADINRNLGSFYD